MAHSGHHIKTPTCAGLMIAILWAHASHPAAALTCADSDPLTPNVPFDCGAYNMVYKPAAADLSVIEGDFTSFLTCCDAATTIGAPPNLYISSQPRQDKHSGKQQQAGNQKLRISGTVGQTMEVQLVVGLQGLQDTRIEGVKLSGSLQGTQLISVAEPDATTPACEVVSSCATKSELTCNWASLSWDSGAATAIRTLTLTIKLTDAGARSSSVRVTADSYVSGNGATVYTTDMNDADNTVQVEPRIKAACCSTTGSCRNTYKKDCPENRSFSPYSACNSKPCLPPTPTRGSSRRGRAAGVCVMSDTCLERVQDAVACRAGQGRYHASSQHCRQVMKPTGC